MSDLPQLPLASVLALTTGLFAMAVSALLLVFFPVGRWRQHRWLFVVALTAGGFGAADVVATAPIPPWVELAGARVQLICAGLHVSAWALYSGADLGPLKRSWQRLLEVLPAALAILIGAVPGIAFTGRIIALPYRVLGANYRSSELTGPAVAGVAVITFCLVVVLARYLSAWQGRRPQALAHCCALGTFVAGGAIDVGTIAGVWHLPLVTAYGVALAVVPITFVLAARWQQDVEEHDALAASLERAVQERTQALTEAQAALGRTEKLAAVGRLAGGMAHEINNPGAALIANLEYLELGLQRGEQLPADVADTVSESLQAARRIARAVRQLLLLSRAAIAESEGHSFDLKSATSQAVRAAKAAEEARRRPPAISTVTFIEQVPPELRSRGRGQILEQALRELLEQLSAAAPQNRACRIGVTARADHGRLRLEVRSDFPGLDAHVREQLAEPFLAARAPGEGASLGLAASLGLLRTLGTEIALEETTTGVSVSLLLDAAPAPPVAPPPAA